MATLFEFDLGGQTYKLAIANNNFYVLDGLRLLPVRVWPAWCEGCQKFTASEQISSIEEEAKTLREVELFAERPGLIPPDRHVSIRQLPNLRRRMQWRKQRRSPARCLECASTEITPIRPGPEVYIAGRGKCVARCRGWADMSGPTNAYYDSEGERRAFRSSKAPSRSA